MEADPFDLRIGNTKGDGQLQGCGGLRDEISEIAVRDTEHRRNACKTKVAQL